MPDDLFGSHNAAWERFKTPVPKKRSRFVPAPVQVLSVPEEMAEKIRARRQAEAYQSGLDTLNEWRHKLPPMEWDRLKAKLEQAK